MSIKATCDVCGADIPVEFSPINGLRAVKGSGMEKSFWELHVGFSHGGDYDGTISCDACETEHKRIMEEAREVGVRARNDAYARMMVGRKR